MERDTRLMGWSLAILLLGQISVSAAASTQPQPAPFAWTSAIGAVDADVDDAVSGTAASSADREVQPRVAWNAAFATYNLSATDAPAHNAYVFVPSAAPKVKEPAAAVRALESLRTASVPIPAAWWLLLSGLIGVVGVARRRTA